MTYEIGQPVVWAGRESDAYTQEFGPDQGKPVVYGIVTDDRILHVWWEYCSDAYSCKKNEVKPCDGRSFRSKDT